MEKFDNKVFLNDENVIEVVYNGDQSYDSVIWVVREVNRLSESMQRQNMAVLVLSDLEGLGATTLGSRQAAYEGLKTMKYDKIALFKTTRFLQYVANIIIKASGKGFKVKYFNSRKEAAKWLKSSTVTQA